jgi:hypothetical protein
MTPLKRFIAIVCYENGHRTGTYLIRDEKGIEEFIRRNRQHEYITGFIVINIDTGERQVIENDGD